ncbi:MAG TPA: Hpt domain-containing protein [Desulfocapsa sulfexigens]|nr:Hpt domain-containing protein [Desulfocapsa sulfexigens]
MINNTSNKVSDSDIQQPLCEIAVENLQKIYNLKPDQVKTLLLISIQTLADSLATARVALDSSNSDDLQNAAHKIKGTLAGLGLTREAALAEGIELGIRQDNQNDNHVLLENLSRSVQPLLLSGTK